MSITHPQAGERSLRTMIDDFLTDLARFAAFYAGPAGEITADVLRAFFATLAHLSPASRARKQAA